MVSRRQPGDRGGLFALPATGCSSELDEPLWLALIFVWLFGVVMGSALAVVRHADHVAEVARRALRHAGADALGHRHRGA